MNGADSRQDQVKATKANTTGIEPKKATRCCSDKSATVKEVPEKYTKQIKTVMISPPSIPYTRTVQPQQLSSAKLMEMR